MIWVNHPCKMRDNFMSRARSLSFQQCSAERAFIFLFFPTCVWSCFAKEKMDYAKPDFCIPQLDPTPDSCFCLRAGDTRCVPLTCVSSTSKARTSSAVCFLFQFLRCSWRTQTRFICLKTHHIIYFIFFRQKVPYLEKKKNTLFMVSNRRNS